MAPALRSAYTALRSLFRLFFPRNCALCGEPLVGDEHDICSHCLLEIPELYTTLGSDNFIERRLRGRIPICESTALLLFQRHNLTQKILHQIKYYSNEKLAVAMGERLGLHIAECRLFDDVDIIVPVPLHRRKQRQRGYNQSLLLCKGIVRNFPRPIVTDNLVRIRYTETQTRKSRQERLDNMKDVFAVTDPSALQGKHLLLVDDVITTGATTEACWLALQHVDNVRISVAALAVTGDT